jgi:hypothetical protein
MKTLKTTLKKLMKKGRTYFKTHSTKQLIAVGVFIALTAILVVHSIILTLFYIDNDYEYNIYGFTYTDAILSGQDTTEPMRTGIVRIHEFTFETITTDEKIVMCCDFDTDKNFVHFVESIDEANKTLETSYTGNVANTLSEDDIIGVYEKDANVFGTIYYTAMYTQGYILLILSHLLLGLGYYYIFIFDNPNRFFKKDIVKSNNDHKKRAS